MTPKTLGMRYWVNALKSMLPMKGPVSVPAPVNRYMYITSLSRFSASIQLQKARPGTKIPLASPTRNTKTIIEMRFQLNPTVSSAATRLRLAMLMQTLSPTASRT